MTKKQFGETLRQFRLRYYYTTDKIAEYLGVAKERVEQWENGDEEIPLAWAMALSNLYAVPVHEMFQNVNYRKMIPETSYYEYKHESWVNHLANNVYAL